MIKYLLKKKYLRRIMGIKQETLEKIGKEAKADLESGAEAEASFWTAVWSCGITGTFIVIVDVLSDVHDTFVFSANV